MTHRLRARYDHPRLYALGQHPITRLLHGSVWTPKALKTAKRLRTPLSATERAYAPHTHAHATIIVNGNAYFS